jgi:3-phenylpropionate/trans-cinnamate dioxygenase ferredoxin reductase subunit
MSRGQAACCVIVGTGHAGARAAMRLRRLGWDKAIALIGEEDYLPYHRPPLSKDYLKGGKSIEAIQIASATSFDKAEVEIRLAQRVVRIDRANKRVELDTGRTVAYDKLLLAIGARPKALSLPGAHLKGVHYLRNVNDVDRIRAAVRTGGRAIVIGGGYIGLEVAASLRHLGMQVTVLEALDRVLKRVTSEPLSRFFSRIHGEEGTIIRTGAGVEAIVGEDVVRGVQVSATEVLDADIVIIGIGVRPNTELAEEAGLEIADGIVVDEFARTSDPDIYAAGDCACFRHPDFEGRIRLESVQNAHDQAVIAASAISGKPVPYDAVPWFWSDQYDVKLQIAGLAVPGAEIIVRGDPAEGRNLTVIHLKDGRLVAIDAANNPRDFVQGGKLIAGHAMLDPAKASDPSLELAQLAV